MESSKQVSDRVGQGANVLLVIKRNEKAAILAARAKAIRAKHAQLNTS